MSNILDYVLPLTRVENREDLHSQIVLATAAMGFDLFSAGVLVDHPDGSRDIESLHNMPAAFQAEWLDPDLGKIDPVMQHCKHSSIPLIWNQGNYTAVSQGDKWETMAMYGLQNGVTIASHHGNRHFCLGLDRAGPMTTDSRELTRIYSDVTLLSVYAQDAALRILVEPVHGSESKPALTPRERESLQWSCEGKTAWEIGKILHVSEGTIAKFLQSAQVKLHAVNKTATVAKALRLGLL